MVYLPPAFTETREAVLIAHIDRHDFALLVTHGAADRLALPAAAKYTAAKISGAKLSLYDGIGHAPFWEDTARFNAELAAFVRAANKTN